MCSHLTRFRIFEMIPSCCEGVKRHGREQFRSTGILLLAAVRVAKHMLEHATWLRRVTASHGGGVADDIVQETWGAAPAVARARHRANVAPSAESAGHCVCEVRN